MFMYFLNVLPKSPLLNSLMHINQLVQDWLKRTILKYVNICGRKLFGLKAIV